MGRATGGVHLPYQGLLGMLRNVEPMGHCCWESVLFWPLMWPDGKGWAPFKVNTWAMPLSERLVRPLSADSHIVFFFSILNCHLNEDEEYDTLSKGEFEVCIINVKWSSVVV